MEKGLSAQRGTRKIWEQFLNDTSLLARLRVTDDEIAILKTLVPFGALKGSDDLVFILGQIRRSQRRG
jgi:hypothetical protein